MYHINIYLLKQQQLPPHCTFLVIFYEDCLFILQDPVNSKDFILPFKLLRTMLVFILNIDFLNCIS